MSHVVLLHSAHGLDEGMLEMAQTLRDAGNQVSLPDYFNGRTFTEAEAGVAHRDEVGFPELVRRTEELTADLSGPLVFAGFSLGAALAQRLGRTDPRARAAVLMHAGGTPKPATWPHAVALQVHHSVADPWVERAQVETLMSSAAEAGARAAHYLYRGDGHLFADPTKPDHDPESAALLWHRVTGLLGDCDSLESDR